MDTPETNEEADLNPEQPKRRRRRSKKRIKIKKRVRVKKKKSKKKKLKKVMEKALWWLVILAFIITMIIMVLELQDQDGPRKNKGKNIRNKRNIEWRAF